MDKQFRVLHCPTVVGGNAPQLAKAERAVGVLSRSVTYETNGFGYEADEVLWDADDNMFDREIKRWKLLRRALADFDIIHFNFGRTFMREAKSCARSENPEANFPQRLLSAIYGHVVELRDLSWLTRAGKGIVITFQGDDARQGDFLKSNFEISPIDEVVPSFYSATSDAAKRRRIKVFERYADRIYALNPDLLHVLPASAKFLPYSHVDIREWRPRFTNFDNRHKPMILHAPTNRQAKGTRFLLSALDRLRAEGVPFSFQLIEGKKRAEAKGLYEQADILVDQLLYGWYGGLAVELMALGKPVISYIRQDDLRYVPKDLRGELPIIPANPKTIYAVLKSWLTERKSELVKVGKKSRAFVERWHDPMKIAEHMKREYQGILAGKK